MQNEISSGFYTFPNVGYYLGKVPAEVLSTLRKEIRNITNEFESNEKITDKLAGNIELEFDLISSRSIIENYVLQIVQEYDYHFKYLSSINSLNCNVPLCLDNLWVNFQKKYEFNPNHDHTGVMSFVIWIKIPFDNLQEKNTSPGKYANSNQSGNFQFSYSDILGGIRNLSLEIDKSYEGYITVFPNKLMHCVYPFYSSDDFRISVSGNIALKVNDK